MDREYEVEPVWVRLPGHEEPAYPQGAAGARASGVRRMRRASNWTAAALIAGVAAATGYFAHHQPAAAPATSTVTTVPGGTAVSPQKPSLNTPVATSGGSGVTITTGPNGVKHYSYSYRDNCWTR
jgi:ferric-dicitrate binding protein FerR (iron transport regulator)